MFPLPRIIYAIAQDGLIFRVLGNVHEKYKTPVVGTISAAFLTGTFAALFDLKALVNMLSIGVLLAYTVVAISILILRFSNNLDDSAPPPAYNEIKNEASGLTGHAERLTFGTFLVQCFNINRVKRPNTTSMTVAATLVLCYVLSTLALALMIFYAGNDILNLHPYAITLASIFLFFALFFMIALSVQPRERTPVGVFSVPLVPILPCTSIFINLFLMLMLDYYTWIRFGIWMIIGKLKAFCLSIFGKGVDLSLWNFVKHGFA